MASWAVLSHMIEEQALTTCSYFSTRETTEWPRKDFLLALRCAPLGGGDMSKNETVLTFQWAYFQISVYPNVLLRLLPL